MKKLSIIGLLSLCSSLGMAKTITHETCTMDSEVHGIKAEQQEKFQNILEDKGYDLVTAGNPAFKIVIKDNKALKEEGSSPEQRQSQQQWQMQYDGDASNVPDFIADVTAEIYLRVLIRTDQIETKLRDFNSDLIHGKYGSEFSLVNNVENKTVSYEKEKVRKFSNSRIEELVPNCITEK